MSVETPGLYQSRTVAHRRRRRVLWWLLAVVPLLLLLGGTGFALEPLRHPLPMPSVERVLPVSYRIPGQPPALPWPGAGQAAVEVEGVGKLGASGSATSVPIASVAKIMTAYVVLVDHPLGPGEEGPSITVTAPQAAASNEAATRGESLVRVTVGARFSERDALESVLLPSANNMARIVAEWDAGSVDAFVAKMNQTATSLGLTGTRYTDPAGYDAGTVSTAADQVVLARKAMALPGFAEIVALSKATVPVAGTVTNYNTLLGQDGVVGVKTGSTDAAGGCFVFAAKITVGGRELSIIGAVLGQPGVGTPQQLRSVFNASQALIRAAGKALVVDTVIRAGQPIAAVRGPFDRRTTLSAAQDVTALGWPGMEVRLSLDIPRVPRRLPAGTDHGRLTVSAGDTGTAETVLRSTDRLEPPDTWTRVKRHR